MRPIKHAVISAAGFGSRLGMNTPKCLVQVDGHALIDYQLDLLRDIPFIHVVVGFKEEEVINYVRQRRSDAIFVRNPQFHCTSNSYSVHLASRYLNEPFLIVDGDLLIKKSDFQASMVVSMPDSWIGVTECKSEEPVYAKINAQNHIENFSFNEPSHWEWCGVALVPPHIIQPNKGYVFEELKKILPALAVRFALYEIDTPQDYALAINHIRELGYTFND